MRHIYATSATLLRLYLHNQCVQIKRLKGVFMVDAVNNSNNAIGWSNTRDLYNGVEGNKEKFIEIFSQTITHKQGTTQAELDAHAAKVYDYLASMDKDDKQGLTREEYADGLKSKLDTATEKYTKLMEEKDITQENIDKFKNMTDVEKLNYITEHLADKKNIDKTEAKIEATKILAEINQLDQELFLVRAEIDTIKTLEKDDKTKKEMKTSKDLLKDFEELPPNEQKEVLKTLEKWTSEKNSTTDKNSTDIVGKIFGEKTAETLKNQNNPPANKVNTDTTDLNKNTKNGKTVEEYLNKNNPPRKDTEITKDK